MQSGARDQRSPEQRALDAGWFKLKRGWYHAFAWNYWGMFDDPTCYRTAEELCEREGL